QIGEAEARLRSARTYVETTAERVWQAVVASGELLVSQRMDIRMAATFAIHEANTVADTAWHAAGSDAIFQSGAFERRLRDIRTVLQQAQGRKSHLQDTGAFLLGWSRTSPSPDGRGAHSGLRQAGSVAVELGAAEAAALEIVADRVRRQLGLGGQRLVAPVLGAAGRAVAQLPGAVVVPPAALVV